MATSTRSNDLVFLLGAGCSVEAGIPASAAMIGRIEENVRSEHHWKKFEHLYYHVKSAIAFGQGIKGPSDTVIAYNIETLASTLYQLEQNENHPLYPFIAAWNSRFIALASEPGDSIGSFARVGAFRRKILDALQKWVGPETLSGADYYSGFHRVQKEVNYPLHIFSLNYDLCFERLARICGANIETGFLNFGSTWDWRRFAERDDPEPDFYLYKLHGSLDWVRDPANGTLARAENAGAIPADRLEVIFGRDFKLEASDPYLFYAYQFRIRTLEAKLLIAIGYGFDDVHINKMMSQAMLADTKKVLAVLSNCQSEADKKLMENKVCRSLQLSEGTDRIRIMSGAAKAALEQEQIAAMLLAHLPQDGSAPF